MDLSREQLLEEIADLQARLRQSEEALEALESGAVNKEHRVQAEKLQTANEKIAATHRTINWEDLNRAQTVAQTGCWRMDVRQNELLWSDETHRLFGIPPGTRLSYETFLTFVHPEDREYVDRQWLAALEGEPYDIEHRIMVGDSVKWVRERAELEFDSQCQLLGGFGTVQDITDCKWAKEALRQSEERLRLSQSVAGIGIWEWHPQKQVLEWTSELEKLYGLQPGTIRTYRDLQRLIHPEDLPRIEAEHDAAVAQHLPFNIEFRILHASGEMRWIQARGGAFYNDDGTPSRVFGVNIDITERKLIEKALQESEERLRMAQRAARVGVWDWQPQKQAVEWTPEMEELYGCHPGSINTYQDWSRLIHPEDLSRIIAERDAAIAQHIPFNLEFRIVLPSGETRWLHSRGGASYSDEGCLLRISGIDIDITERKQIEKALQESETRLRLALESANAGIWQWDPQTNNDFWSDELWQLYGLDPHSSKPSYDTWRQVAYPDDLPEVEHKLQEAARLGTKFNAEWRIINHDAGVRWIMSRGRPYLDANGQISSYLGISLDITERKQAEQELQESRQRLRLLANQLLTSQEQERKRLALELHDELGHALLILKFALGDIAQKLPPEHEEVKYLLQEQLEYIRHVIKEVRRLYRDLSPGDVENLGLTRALKSLINDFANHQPDITWQVDLPKLAERFSLPEKTMIYRLVQEALTNIGKHAEPGQVSISAREENGRLSLVIADDGRGFDLSEVDRDPARGLGLAAMRERIYIMGGSLEIWSKKGRGTKLTFTIPTLPKGV